MKEITIVLLLLRFQQDAWGPSGGVKAASAPSLYPRSQGSLQTSNDKLCYPVGAAREGKSAKQAG